MKPSRSILVQAGVFVLLRCKNLVGVQEVLRGENLKQMVKTLVVIACFCFSNVGFSQFDWPQEDPCESRCTATYDRMVMSAEAQYAERINACVTLVGVTCTGCIAAAFMGPWAYIACVAACGYTVNSCHATIQNGWEIYLTQLHIAGNAYSECRSACERDECV